jgi:hypothetical protein
MHNPYRFCNKSYTSATCGAGTAYPSGASEFSSGFSGVPVARSLVFCAMCCRLFPPIYLSAILFYPKKICLWHCSRREPSWNGGHLTLNNRPSIYQHKTKTQNLQINHEKFEDIKGVIRSVFYVQGTWNYQHATQSFMSGSKGKLYMIRPHVYSLTKGSYTTAEKLFLYPEVVGAPFFYSVHYIHFLLVAM